MKNSTVSVIDQTRIRTAERETSLSRIVPYPIATRPNIPRPNRPFPLPQTAVNNAKPTSPAQTSGHRPTFALQTSAPTPAL
jgi:hypothetical protein